MDKQTAIYIRVSTTQQSTRSQTPDLKRWVNAHFEPKDQDNMKWFRDSATGKNMNHPSWQKLQAAMDRNEIDQVVTWRLDRLNRYSNIWKFKSKEHYSLSILMRDVGLLQRPSYIFSTSSTK